VPFVEVTVFDADKHLLHTKSIGVGAFSL